MISKFYFSSTTEESSMNNIITVSVGNSKPFPKQGFNDLDPEIARLSVIKGESHFQAVLIIELFSGADAAGELRRVVVCGCHVNIVQWMNQSTPGNHELTSP